MGTSPIEILKVLIVFKMDTKIESLRPGPEQFHIKVRKGLGCRDGHSSHLLICSNWLPNDHHDLKIRPFRDFIDLSLKFLPPLMEFRQ
jgi:hypothetical protein